MWWGQGWGRRIRRPLDNENLHPSPLAAFVGTKTGIHHFAMLGESTHVDSEIISVNNSSSGLAKKVTRNNYAELPSSKFKN